jgi:2-polyprenyl-3-methyl-5-hydroxy-6-metoxy-1,4-benzoquinol methylase
MEQQLGASTAAGPALGLLNRQEAMPEVRVVDVGAGSGLLSLLAVR